MRTKKILLLAMVFLLAGCSGKPMELPKGEELRSVKVSGVSEPSGIAIQETKEEIQMILDQFAQAKATREESVNDAPRDAEGILRVDLVHEEGGASTLFVYQKNGKYFAEQPYAGIWEISGEVYDRFLQLAKEADIPRAMMVDGKIYLDTGKAVINAPAERASDGIIDSMVAEDRFPTENDQSNFGVGIEYRYNEAGSLDVMVDGGWVVFETKQ